MISTAYDVIEKSPHSVNEMENILGCDDEMEPLFEPHIPVLDVARKLFAS